MAFAFRLYVNFDVVYNISCFLFPTIAHLICAERCIYLCKFSIDRKRPVFCVVVVVVDNMRKSFEKCAHVVVQWLNFKGICRNNYNVSVCLSVYSSIYLYSPSMFHHFQSIARLDIYRIGDKYVCCYCYCWKVELLLRRIVPVPFYFSLSSSSSFSFI